MPIRILSPDAASRVCGTVKATILDRLTSRPGTPDVTIVPVSNFPDFRFNPELRTVKGPWVMVDFLEYGANVTNPHHLLGKPPNVLSQRPLLPRVCSDARDEWIRLDAFSANNPPAVYFKRELMADSVTPRVRPIDWTCGQPAPPIQTRAEFDARPIEVFHCWGYSNPLRPQLHAAIFEAMATRGINVLSSLDYPWTPDGRMWASIHVPWQARRPMEAVMRLQQQAKISVSLPGFGLKCFRHAESPVGAVMAMTDDPLAWSFPWEHDVNCIRMGRDTMWGGLAAATVSSPLYDIYRASQETIDRYRPDRYVDEYMLPLIREAVA